MSLDVPTTMIEVAQHSELDDAAFVTVVRDSLPYAWQVISQVVGDLAVNPGSEFADHAIPPPDEAARGQLLRALASDAIRLMKRRTGCRRVEKNVWSLSATRSTGSCRRAISRLRKVTASSSAGASRTLIS